MYPDQGLANVAAGMIVGNRKPDTLLNKVIETANVLADCEKLAIEIFNKLRGPSPEIDSKEPSEPQSISSWAMAVNSRALRLREALQQINGDLA